MKREHALRLESTGQAPTKDALLYTASCSCRKWKLWHVSAESARTQYAAHAANALDFDGEPDPETWKPCATCGHDMYVHQHVGYGGCLYGEGCKCERFVT